MLLENTRIKTPKGNIEYIVNNKVVNNESQDNKSDEIIKEKNPDLKIKLEDLPEYERQSFQLKRFYQSLKAQSFYRPVQLSYLERQKKDSQSYTAKKEDGKNKYAGLEKQNNQEGKEKKDQAKIIKKIIQAQMFKENLIKVLTPDEKESYKIFTILNSTLSRLIYAYPDLFTNISYYN